VVVGKENPVDSFDTKVFEMGKEFPGSPVYDQASVPTPDQIGIAGVFVNEQEGQILRIDPFNLSSPAKVQEEKRKS